jgi:cysteine desulfuration protein SufE
MQTQLNDIIEDFELFDDELEKYEYIVDLGKGLTPLQNDEKTDVYLIQGCTSLVWIIPSLIDGKMILKGDSNTVIVKGLVAILLKIFSNRTPEEILSFDLKQLNNLGLAEIVTPTRQNGFTSIVNKIIEYTKRNAK